ncbi:MAG: hypothetical protein ABSA01_12185, partial [Anaerolineales bacterium]
GGLVHHVRFKYRSGRFPFHAPIESRFFKKVKGCPALFGQPLQPVSGIKMSRTPPSSSAEGGVLIFRHLSKKHQSCVFDNF